MKTTILTLAALLALTMSILALTTSSKAYNGNMKIEEEPKGSIAWFENYGKSLADRAAQGEFKNPEHVQNIIWSQAQKVSGDFKPTRDAYIDYAVKGFNARLSEITGAKDPYIEKLLRPFFPEGLSNKSNQPFTGEPGEVIEIKEGLPWYVNLSGSFGTGSIASNPSLYNCFLAQNRKGAVESSEVFNFEKSQDRESKKQRFIQKLERAGWQRLGEDRMKWNGL